MIVVTVPIPPLIIRPNGRTRKWQAKAAELKRYRRDCYLSALADLCGRGPGWTEAAVNVRWFGKTRSCLRMDRDNIIGALKAAIDGLTDAGMWENDHGVKWGTVEIDVCKLDPRVELVIEGSK